MSDDTMLRSHPILPIPAPAACVPWTWAGQSMLARPGDTVASALHAAGIHTFGHHHADGSPQGLFCANGQCSQCTVQVDGVPVKACMTLVGAGMQVAPCDGRPTLPREGPEVATGVTSVRRVPVLVIGAGPAGLSAAAELGRLGIATLVVDDKDRPGGKLVLQTHKFFGTVAESYAGLRGIDIAARLAREASAFSGVEIWPRTTAVGVFREGRVGVVRDGRYLLVEPDALLVAAGAREKQVPFPGHTLPGVLGAGAFQTLLNRDLVRPCRRLFVLGGGNVGLIAAYHALQAGIEVAGLAEARPVPGGYRVHADKLRRLGVPIHLAHTVVEARGRSEVESVTIAEVDRDLRPRAGTERSFAVDALLIAAGLAPLDDLYRQALALGMKAWAAGDAEAISEASGAVFGGRIAARRIARRLHANLPEVPPEWSRLQARLAARPGRTVEPEPPALRWVLQPVFHCHEEIPCNPCVTACPYGVIQLAEDPILGVPRFMAEECSACAMCVSACPGQAVALVDARRDPKRPLVTVAWEMDRARVQPGAWVTGVDEGGAVLGLFRVASVRDRKPQDRTLLVQLEADRATAWHLAGIRVQEPTVPVPAPPPAVDADDVIVCRCERVTAGRIRRAIRSGIRDLNELKAALRIGMGACGGRTCGEHVLRLYREEGIDGAELAPSTLRPLFAETPLAVFATGSDGPWEKPGTPW